jgi:hypothetical protein
MIKSFKKMKIAELEKEIQYHNHRYWDLNDPVISDYNYDKLVRELQRKSPNSLLLKSIGSAATPAVKNDKLPSSVFVFDDDNNTEEKKNKKKYNSEYSKDLSKELYNRYHTNYIIDITSGDDPIITVMKSGSNKDISFTVKEEDITKLGIKEAIIQAEKNNND